MIVLLQDRKLTNNKEIITPMDEQPMAVNFVSILSNIILL